MSPRPSNLTGNFDLCVELTDAALTGFAAPIFRGTTKTFALPQNISGVPESVYAEVVLNIHDLTVTAAPTPSQPRGANIAIDFVDSSLTFKPPNNPAYAGPLQGTIEVSGAAFTFHQVDLVKTLQLDLSAASVKVTTINWHDVAGQPTNLTSIANAFAEGLGLPVALVEGMIPQALPTFLGQALNGVGAVPISAAVFHLVPAGQSGSPGKSATATEPAQPPTFAGVDDCTIAATDTKPGVLCILATMFHPDLPTDAISAKTVVATDKTHTGSLTISPDGFQNLFILEAQESGQLPTPPPSITTSLENNVIGLNMAGSTSGTGYTATWTLDGNMTASIANGGLALDLSGVTANASAELDWWVWLLGLGGVVGPPDAIGAFLAALQAKITAAVKATVQSMIKPLTEAVDSATAAISGIPITFENPVTVVPQGIIMRGAAQLPPVFGTIVQGMVTDPNEVPIEGAIVTINPPGVFQGYYAQSGPTGKDGRYAFGADLNVFASDPNATGPNPSYPIAAAQADYITVDKRVTITWGQITTVDFVLAPVQDITVTGHVLATGHPVAGASVTLAQGEPPGQLIGEIPMLVDPTTGVYTIKTNPSQYTDVYTVFVTAPGYPEQVRPIGTIANGATVEEDFTLVAPHPFTITGTVSCVLDSFNDTNVVNEPGAKVTVFPKVQPSPPLPAIPPEVTDKNGSYTIGPVNPGAYTGDYAVRVELANVGTETQYVQQPIGASLLGVDFQFTKYIEPPVPPPAPHGTPVTPGKRV